MQIHELNNFTGTLGSGAYLAIDDGTDTGKISSQELLAATEARIDNIIAGPAPSAEEIVDARLGADGVTYPSLGDAIRDQFTDVKADFNSYNGAMFGGQAYKISPFEQGIISNNGGEGDYAYSCRSIGFNLIAGFNTISYTAVAGYRYALRFYDANKSIVQYTAMATSLSNQAINANARYMRLVIMNTGDNVLITPSEVNALNIVVSFGVTSVTKAQDTTNLLNAVIGGRNPLQPMMFDSFYWAKGAYTQTLVSYGKPTYINSDTSAYNAATAGADITYGFFAYKLNTNCLIDKIANAAGTINNLAFLINTNNVGTVDLYLSTGTVWGGANSSCRATITLKKGINVLKPKFAFYQDSSSATKYQYLIISVSIRNDLILEVSAINDASVYDWMQDAFESIPTYDADLLCWGDSLTAGAGGNGTTYPDVCATELGITVLNCGVGGETANTIAARQGGNNLVVPAGAINGTYTLSQMGDTFESVIAPLRQGNGNNSGNKIYINGEECTLAISQQSVIDPDATYTISGYTGGSSAVPLLGKFAGCNFLGKIVTIFVGTNGYEVDGDTSVDALIGIIDSMIAHIGHNKYVVMGLSNGQSSNRDDIDAAMLKHYGSRFFPTRTLLCKYGLDINGLTPTADDTIYISLGIVPESLRTDSTHMNAYGYTAIGKLLADKIKALGYV